MYRRSHPERSGSDNGIMHLGPGRNHIRIGYVFPGIGRRKGTADGSGIGQDKDIYQGRIGGKCPGSMQGIAPGPSCRREFGSVYRHGGDRRMVFRGIDPNFKVMDGILGCRTGDLPHLRLQHGDSGKLHRDIQCRIHAAAGVIRVVNAGSEQPPQQQDRYEVSHAHHSSTTDVPVDTIQLICVCTPRETRGTERSGTALWAHSREETTQWMVVS